jgi:hypothetical protein
MADGRQTRLNALSTSVPSSNLQSLVGLCFIKGGHSERGAILAQVDPEHYLVHHLPEEGQQDKVKPARVISVREMGDWRFFESEADLNEWANFEANSFASQEDPFDQDNPYL